MVDHLAADIARRHPSLRGFTRANLFRMRQFFDTYRGDEKVAPLVRQLPWTHNLLILGTSRQHRRQFRNTPAFTRRHYWTFVPTELDKSITRG